MSHHQIRGFTLIELLVVLVILGLLAGLVVPSVIRSLERSKHATLKPQIKLIEPGVEMFRLDTGRVPENLNDLLVRPGQVDFWSGPFLEPEQLVDPWGRKVDYQLTDDSVGYLLTFWGNDGVPGGQDLAADVHNRSPSP